MPKRSLHPRSPDTSRARASACAALVLSLAWAWSWPLAGCASTPSEPTAPTTPASAVRTRWTTFATSAQGLPLELTRIGSGRRRMLIIGSIHGDETEGLAAIDEVCACAERHGRQWTTTIVRDMNPDGTARRTRANARGVDLNRNWPARSFRPGRTRGDRPLSEPETAAVHALLVRERPDVIVVFHSIGSGPFVNFDGPADAYAEAFASSAGWRVVESMDYPTPGSLGSFAGADRSIPVLTVEFRRGRPPAPGGVGQWLAAVYRR